VVGEVALAFVILIGCGADDPELCSTGHNQSGLRFQNVVTARVELNFTKYSTQAAIHRFTDDLVERLSGNGSVRAVALASEFPASSSNAQNLSTFVLRGAEVTDSSRLPKAELSIVTPDYFGAIGVPIVTGRAFTAADRDTAAPSS
jgi:hypothetical protein